MNLELVLRAYMSIGLATAAAHDRRPRRSTRWRRAACTTTSAAGSPATPSTASGSCPTSRRCSTTRRCSSRVYLPRRTRCSATTTMAPGRRRDDRVRAARPAPSRRRLLLGRGRRLARRARPRPRGAVPHVDARRGRAARPRRLAERRRRRGARVVRHHRRSGNFEGRSIPNRLDHRGELPGRPRSRRRGALLFDATAQRRRARSRRQGAHRVERAVPLDAGRGRGDVRPRRLARRPRSPTASSCSASCGDPTGAGTVVAGRRHAAGPPRRARRRPRRARRRLHPARRGHRRGALDRRRA